MTTTCKSKSSRRPLLMIMIIVKPTTKPEGNNTILGNLKARAAGADITEADRR